MADSAKKESAKEHNAVARREQIRMILKQAASLEQQRRSAMESNIKPIQDKLTKLFRGLKTDLNIPIGDARAMFKLYMREIDIADWEDQDEADSVKDAMRELFEALQEGEMLDFVQAMQKTEGEKAEAPAKKDTSAAKKPISRTPATKEAKGKSGVDYSDYQKWLEVTTDADVDNALSFGRVTKGWATFSSHVMAVTKVLAGDAPKTLSVDDGGSGVAALIFDPETFDEVTDKLTEANYNVLMASPDGSINVMRAREVA